MVTTRPWVVLKCSIRSHVMSLFGQYGQITCGELALTPLAPAPGVAASVVVVWGGDVVLGAGKAEG